MNSSPIAGTNSFNLAEVKNEIKRIYKSYDNKNIVLEELTGLRVSVYKSTDKGRIGIRGIVFKETKNTLQIKCKDRTLKILPKKGSIFKFYALKNSFTVKGEEIGFRSYERTKKSLKFYKIRKTQNRQIH